ncbi:SpoIID/LytB domain-containing protein [Thermohalobacter berrensis]|uniref:Sporulation protein n=1 Tax=Thermohalobacter berrensis TaxID=99594 RepID=A0A419T8U1_9FIRM|nr:SpoIID/LytB domain-containing protein [Thermohalobacter berrensis]RKD33891.1 sporulation protein [Thermohalobacter berrensis]
MRYSKIIFLILVIVLLSGCLSEFSKPGIEKPHIPNFLDRDANGRIILKVYVLEKDKVERMNIENYVAGVVAGEMGNDWPLEALKAQAILARTYVMHFIKNRGGSKYKNANISTDVKEAQAWNIDAVNERIKNAVESTRGQVVLYNGDYIKAWFHAHSGGNTALAKEGLNYKYDNPPYIRIVKSKDSNKAPKNDTNWSYTFTKTEIKKACWKMKKDINDFNSIIIEKRGPSGRVVSLRIGNITVNGPTFRLNIGPGKLKSTLIDIISVNGNKVTFTGRGYGHGVGMSQWGAYQLAKEGMKAEEIIKYYFKDVNIVNLWK